jgi:MFS family permease
MTRGWPTGGLWRHSDFLKLWSAETISQFGTQVSNLAIPLTAILVLGASAFEVAALGTVLFLPFILFTLPAGVWVDRLPRRPILILGDLGRAALLGTIPVAYVADVLTIWQLYAVAFLVGVCTVFFDIAYQSYLPSLVDRGHLVEGNSKLEISRSAAQIGGPGFGGILVDLLTAPYAVLLDALSFVGSGLFIFRIRKREERVGRHATDGQSMWTELKEGFGFVVGNRYLRSIAGSTMTFNFFGSLAFSIYLVYAVRSLELSPAVIGIVFAIGNVGALVGAVTANRLSRRLGVGPTIVGSQFLGGPAWLLVPIAPKEIAVPFLVSAQIAGGFANVVYNVTQVSFRQALAPERLQGRMNAVMRFLVWGTIPLGTLLGGAFATWIGLRETLFIGAIGTCLAFLPVALSPVRRLRVMPTAPVEPVPEHV